MKSGVLFVKADPDFGIAGDENGGDDHSGGLALLYTTITSIAIQFDSLSHGL